MDERKIYEAIAIVLTCKEKIFLIKRQNFLSAFPGYIAFPGGKIEAEDFSIENHQEYIPGFFKKYNAYLVRAIKREMIEELGLDIFKILKKKQIQSFSHLTSLTTPKFSAKRFKTHFFRIDLISYDEFKIDRGEIAEFFWTTPSSFIKEYEKGKKLIVPPLYQMIKSLGADFKQRKLGFIQNRLSDNEKLPCIEVISDIFQIFVRSNTLPPAKYTNCFLLLSETKKEGVLIDPSPKNMVEYHKLERTIQGMNIKILGIILTHHHQDHCEHSNQLAKKISCPLLMSKYTHDAITKRNEDFFDNLEVEFLKENQRIFKWKNMDVIVKNIPGHDEGQVGLTTKSKEWFLVGDLIQGVGTVVIHSPEGDMVKYFSSLEYVLKYDPAIIFPSHGLALGGAYFLKKVLQHRQDRENEILILYKSGKDKIEILKKIYKDINPLLNKAAYANICSHLEKLEREGKIN